MTKKVYIASGHGGSDAGACANGLKEKDLTLKISKACRDYLLSEYKDVEVMMSRTDDRYVDYVTYSKAANTWGADVAIDNHINAGGGVGCETETSGTTASRNLSIAILNELHGIGMSIHSSTPSSVSSGVKTPKASDGSIKFAFNRIPNAPSPIVEFFFIDNKTDCRWADKCKALGEAEARGIAKYLGLEKKDAPKAEPKKKEQPCLIAEGIHDERRKLKGGKPGDQTGDEVRITPWRDFGQTYVFCWKDKALAALFVKLLLYFCKNEKIGYDQSNRNSLWNHLAAKNKGKKTWKAYTVTALCECVCSTLIAVALRFCGVNVGKGTLSGAMIARLKASRKFYSYKRTGKKPYYFTSGDRLPLGAILVKNGHIAAVVQEHKKTA